MRIINKIFQVLMDIVIGVAVYFGINAFFPALTNNAVVVITLTTTALFAELIEVRFKK